MAERIDYDLRAGSVRIEDITSDEVNAAILRRLKENDPGFGILYIAGDRDEVDWDVENEDGQTYVPSSRTEMGWLGYFVGRSTVLTKLYLLADGFDDIADKIELFCVELGRNRSIQKLALNKLSEGRVIPLFGPFLRSNSNLAEIKLHRCSLGSEGCRSLSLGMGEGTTLKSFRISNDPGHIDDFSYIGPRLTDIIVALSVHPQLENLELRGCMMRRNDCTALATLLHWSARRLQKLDLFGAMMSDEGLDALSSGGFMHAALKTLNLGSTGLSDRGIDALTRFLMHSNSLRELILNANTSVTVAGWRTLSVALKSPTSNLEMLCLAYSGITDEGVAVIAEALAGNCKLKELDLSAVLVGPEGCAALTKLLCDTSSISSTYLSNHTIQPHGGRYFNFGGMVPYLDLNKSPDKKYVTVRKILENHSGFDVQPLFQWEFKTLPLIVEWLEKAASYPDVDVNDIDCRKLSVTNQFVRSMPSDCIETITRRELELIRAKKMELQGEQVELLAQIRELEEAEKRALMRLL